ncbi:MAG: hypothetical protein BGO57_08805 [Sphingomonadales bacterium 63-6]|nr:MAG: hypothetical protein BGO57_08805 [Sphingomonadales bacterium 63-6]
MAIHICPNCGCNLTRFEPFAFGNAAIDSQGRILFQGFPVTLPRTLHDIVEALIRAKGRGLTRSVLANILDGDVNDATISKYIERARAAFRVIDPEFDQIVCLRGFGAYSWTYRRPSALRRAAAIRSGISPNNGAERHAVN